MRSSSYKNICLTTFSIVLVRRLARRPDKPNTDLQRALKLEPNNEAVKTELARVDELILRGKKGNKPVRPFLAFSSLPLPSPRFVLAFLRP